MVVFPRRTLLKGASLGPLVAGLTRAMATGDPPAGRASRRVKIGQIGVGHAHATKLSVYRASADYEVVGIVEPDQVLREQAQAQAPFRDLPGMTQEQLLNVPGLEAVLVET